MAKNKKHQEHTTQTAKFNSVFTNKVSVAATHIQAFLSHSLHLSAEGKHTTHHTGRSSKMTFIYLLISTNVIAWLRMNTWNVSQVFQSRPLTRSYVGQSSTACPGVSYKVRLYTCMAGGTGHVHKLHCAAHNNGEGFTLSGSETPCNQQSNSHLK